MNTFFSRLTSGRRGSCPPAFLPSRGRRPAREIATRELRSECSISRPALALPPDSQAGIDSQVTRPTDIRITDKVTTLSIPQFTRFCMDN